MQRETLIVEDLAGPRAGLRILRLKGPLTITNLYEFQSKVRSDSSQTLVVDLTDVPYVDSAGIGSLVGAYVTHQKEDRQLFLVGVNDRVRTLMQVTHVEQFFRIVDSPAAACA